MPKVWLDKRAVLGERRLRRRHVPHLRLLRHGAAAESQDEEKLLPAHCRLRVRPLLLRSVHHGRGDTLRKGIKHHLIGR